jgi:hypothetical protein
MDESGPVCGEVAYHEDEVGSPGDLLAVCEQPLGHEGAHRGQVRYPVSGMVAELRWWKP